VWSDKEQADASNLNITEDLEDRSDIEAANYIKAYDE
jgi:hypothetical protein